MKTNTKILMLLIGLAAISGISKLNAQTAIEVCVDAGAFTIAFDAQMLPAYMLEGGNGQPSTYNVTFASQIISGNFLNLLPQRTITIQMPSNIYPNHYNAKVVLTNNVNHCTYTLSFKVDVLYPSSIMKRNTANVNPSRNVLHDWINIVNIYGYDLTNCHFQWYKNGIITNGAIITNDIHYCLDNNLNNYVPIPPGLYSVEVTRPDGTKMMSCPITIK